MNGTYAVRAAPSALRGLLQLRLETHEVIGPGAGVTQNDLTALLTHLTVVLMVRLVAVSVLSFTQEYRDTTNISTNIQTACRKK